MFADEPNVEVDTFDGLLVDYARDARRERDRARPARRVGFRVRVPDGADEPAPAADVETVFMMPAEQYTYISSRLVKEVFALGGDVDGLVPPVVEARLRAKRPPRRRAKERA